MASWSLWMVLLMSAWSTFCGYRMGLLHAESKSMKAEKDELEARRAELLRRFGRG